MVKTTVYLDIDTALVLKSIADHRGYNTSSIDPQRPTWIRCREAAALAEGQGNV